MSEPHSAYAIECLCLHEPKTSTKQDSSGKVEDKLSPIKSVFSLKMVGGIAAVVSLFLALNQFTGVIQHFRIHHADFTQTMKMGEQQMQREEYPQAFESFKHARELDPIDRDAQQRQAQAGMMWLDNAHSAEMSFKNTADAVQPVLERALTGAKGEYAGDLAAHIGWANFLRLRDDATGNLAIESSYKQALSFDPGNVYAHAMLGHWILWNNGNLNDAREHFLAAIATGKRREYVRTMQIAALLNHHSADDDLLRVGDQMRRGGEPLSQAERKRLFDELFILNLQDNAALGRLVTAVGTDELAADYDWLGEGSNSDGDPEQRQWRKAYILGFQAETNGDKKQALARYQALQAELQQTQKTHPGGTMDAMIEQAMKRVTQ
jgi:tetratricopeptide (TPR) repeat protein